MKIVLTHPTVREVYEGYVNQGFDGVVGYKGLLDIRPKFQREFVYDAEQQKAVISSILGGFPLNVMYWSKDSEADKAEHYEMLDGQQRTMSICEYVSGQFSVDVGGYPKNFDNLSEADRNKILDYKLMVYICDGDEDERLAWFRVINIAGLRLKEQELRNAVYTGPWLTDAKRYFSRESQGAHRIAKDYVNCGEVNRQDLLQKAIEWLAGRGDDSIKAYMNDHRNDPNADELWTYFKSVIDWAKLKFPKVRTPMKSVDWAGLYERYKDARLDATELEERVRALMADPDVTKKAGVYEYVLSGDERVLNIRQFDAAMKLEAYERQGGLCPRCPAGTPAYELNQMHGDHITPWSLGGKTNADNCQMLCADCNRRKTNI